MRWFIAIFAAAMLLVVVVCGISAENAFTVVVWGFIFLVLLGVGMRIYGAVSGMRANREAARRQKEWERTGAKNRQRREERRRSPAAPAPRRDGYQTTYWDERGRPRCAECDKIAYPNEARAAQVVSQAEKREEYFRAYYEDRCGNWHLTSQLEEPVARVGAWNESASRRAAAPRLQRYKGYGSPPQAETVAAPVRPAPSGEVAADSGSDSPWLATLIVGGESDTSLGFNSSPVSGYGSLSNNRFPFEGGERQVSRIALSNGRLDFSTDIELPVESVGDLALRMNGRTFAFRDARNATDRVSTFYTYRWPGAGLSWRRAEKIAVELVR